MSNRKTVKKRNKAYHGPDAATGPRVTRYSVTEEGAFKAWWKENKRIAIFRSILAAIAVLISWLIVTIVN